MPNVAHDPHASVDESVDGTAGGSVDTGLDGSLSDAVGRVGAGSPLGSPLGSAIGVRARLFDRDVDTRRARRENRSSEERSGDDDHGEPSTLNGTGSHDVSVVDQAMLTRSSQSSLK